ncbi:glycosyltransferase family 1 protein [Clostridium sp. UBA871]|uniref:glycosyltransferase family 1 protein n=1 Tax=Clostridium sp. UBA871 TaxID=1946380 RepID=UPI003217E466
MIKVLHIVPALDGGGVENLLLNYYNNINRNIFKFDFIVFGQEKGALESTFEKLGSKIYHIPPRHVAFFSSLKQMKKIICSNRYDIVHTHQNRMSFIPLFFAEICGIQMRIAHSHMAYEPENLLKKIERKLCSWLIKCYATEWFACGIDATKWLYGKKAVTNVKGYIMNNAINIEKFIFNENTRRITRKELDIEGKFVIGNVGRLSYQKNHEFLIRIFNEIYKLNKNAILLLVGRGELENEVREQVENLGLQEVVKFLGVRNDVPQLLQAMDVFLLPSRYEGLGIVYIEAQATGLASFGSDKVVPKEAKITDLMHFIDLKESPKYWASEILKYDNGYERNDLSVEIVNRGYDIKREARKLELIYEKSKK